MTFFKADFGIRYNEESLTEALKRVGTDPVLGGYGATRTNSGWLECGYDVGTEVILSLIG